MFILLVYLTLLLLVLIAVSFAAAFGNGRAKYS